MEKQRGEKSNEREGKEMEEDGMGGKIIKAKGEGDAKRKGKRVKGKKRGSGRKWK